MTRRRTITVLSAAALSVLGFLVAPATAEPARGPVGAFDQGPKGDALATISQAYLNSNPGLTPAAARRAAQAQSAGERLKAQITKQWKTFGGGWFDPFTATYHLTVTTADSGRSLAAIGSEMGVAVDTPLVKRNLDELNAEADALRNGNSELAKAAAGKVGVDVKTNQVVVDLTGAKNVEADACTSRTDCDDFEAAGLVIRNGNPGQHWCSIGFTARNAADQRITLTAGHCSTGVGQVWTNGTSTIRIIGSVSGRIDAGVQDVTRIVSTNNFYGDVHSGRIYIGPPNVTSPVTGESFLLNGDVVCLSASYTNPTRFGNPCATVGSTSDAAVRGMVRIEGYDACGGDSGGGWYWFPPSGNRWAVALHSRSTSGCNATPATSWASPLNSFYSDLVYENS